MNLDLFRKSTETVPRRKLFVNIHEYKIGVQIDQEKEEFRFYLYQKRRLEPEITEKWLSYDLDFLVMRDSLYRLVEQIYQRTLPSYTKIELTIAVQSLFQHINAGSIHTLLEKEVIYN